MLAQGLIVLSRSHVVSPVLLVPKADSSLCPCVDYKRLNSVTEKDHYTMPLIPEIVNMIAGSKILSNLDLKDAFNQIPVLPEHRNFTAFKCHKGVFKYKMMPFGLQNAPAVFQRMINHVLGDLVRSCCAAYMDVILVFSKGCKQHTANIKRVLAALSSSNPRLKPSKCELYQEEVFLFGKVILRDGHAICPEKTKAFLDFGKPRSKTEVRGFLGSVNFLRRLCKNISKIGLTSRLSLAMYPLFGASPSRLCSMKSSP